jgi:hypothetical protein
MNPYEKLTPKQKRDLDLFCEKEHHIDGERFNCSELRKMIKYQTIEDLIDMQDQIQDGS